MRDRLGPTSLDLALETESLHQARERDPMQIDRVRRARDVAVMGFERGENVGARARRVLGGERANAFAATAARRGIDSVQGERSRTHLTPKYRATASVSFRNGEKTPSGNSSTRSRRRSDGRAMQNPG